jgi:hypothetical protein
MSSTTTEYRDSLEDAYRRIAPCFGRSEPRARKTGWIRAHANIQVP